MAGRRTGSFFSWLIALTLLAAVTVLGYALSQRFQMVIVDDAFVDGNDRPPAATSIADPESAVESNQSFPKPPLAKSAEPSAEPRAEPGGEPSAEPSAEPGAEPRTEPDTRRSNENLVTGYRTPAESDPDLDLDPDIDPDGRRAFQAMTAAGASSVDPSSIQQDRQAKTRIWTDGRGKFTVRARLVEQTKRAVTLERADDGKQITILIRRLSTADQAYLTMRAGQVTNSAADVASAPPSARTIIGRVARVSDGDTIDVIDPNWGEQRIRLHGIDAPEYTQRFGREARTWLASQIAGKEVRVEIVEKDRYDRWAAHVYLGDRWINGLLVSQGWAWHYHRFSADPQLAIAQRQARASRLGLWQDPQPIAPWSYREKQEATVGFEPTNR